MNLAYIRFASFALALVSFALFSALPAFAQLLGAVTGTIEERNGASAAGVPVRVSNVATAAKFDAITDEAGVFHLEALPLGSYTAVVELQGSHLNFKFDVAQTGQPLDVGTHVMKIASVQEQVTVTARRVEEEAQDVPIALSVVGGALIDRTGTFNVNRLKELIPTVQFYSSNPRNSAITIRGLGSPFGLTNDGIEPGVGFYVDGVFFARPAAATLDFIDLERIEVLRGPQGTLFGKNTTAGAINVTTRKPTFTPESSFEVNFGNLGFIQVKASVSGPLGRKVAGRLSFSGTQRDGQLLNVRTGDDVNDLNNQGIRGQLMYVPTSALVITGAADYTRQRPKGYAQVVAGIAPTLRPTNRQYAQIAADLGYAPPSFNAFDRLIDTDTPWRSTQDMGGGSLTVNWDRGRSGLTAISSWRYWDWKPSNDRDFTGLPVTTISAAPSKQSQWTQEVRYAGPLYSRANFLVGAFFFRQSLKPAPFHKQEQGSAAARFLLAPSAAASTPGLLDGYGQNISFDFTNLSTAVFGQVEFEVTKKLRVTPGLRFNYDQKNLDYDQQVYGGLQTTNAALIALQRSVLSPLTYKADIGDNNVSGQITFSYRPGESINTYATYSTGFKSVGLNLGGVPTDAAGAPIISAARVKPEDVRNIELGVKTQPFRKVMANFAIFNTDVHDLQTQVVNAQVGVLRGYLANAEKARVRGVEFDGTITPSKNLSFFVAAAATDGRYIAFRDAPPPLEDTGGTQVKDISGSVLPGISKWAASFGGEYQQQRNVFGHRGHFFVGFDASARSAYSSNASLSRFLIVDGYALVNTRIGFQANENWTFSAWARNVGGKNYYELLSSAPGNSGLFVGLPGDVRTFGITLRRTFSKTSLPK